MICYLIHCIQRSHKSYNDCYAIQIRVIHCTQHATGPRYSIHPTNPSLHVQAIHFSQHRLLITSMLETYSQHSTPHKPITILWFILKIMLCSRVLLKSSQSRLEVFLFIYSVELLHHFELIVIMSMAPTPHHYYT